MGFFTRKLDTEDNTGRVYVFRLVLDDGTVLHKVGKSSGKSSKTRFFSVLDSFYDKYRYSPRSSIRRDKPTLAPFALESHLHKELEEYKYTFEHKFSGYSEFFYGLDESLLLDYIDSIEDKDILGLHTDMLITEYEAIRDSLPNNDSAPDTEDKIPF